MASQRDMATVCLCTKLGLRKQVAFYPICVKIRGYVEKNGNVIIVGIFFAQGRYNLRIKNITKTIISELFEYYEFSDNSPYRAVLPFMVYH